MNTDTPAAYRRTAIHLVRLGFSTYVVWMNFADHVTREELQAAAKAVKGVTV